MHNRLHVDVQKGGKGRRSGWMRFHPRSKKFICCQFLQLHSYAFGKQREGHGNGGEKGRVHTSRRGATEKQAPHQHDQEGKFRGSRDAWERDSGKRKRREIKAELSVLLKS